MPSYEIVVI